MHIGITTNSMVANLIRICSGLLACGLFECFALGCSALEALVLARPLAFHDEGFRGGGERSVKGLWVSEFPCVVFNRAIILGSRGCKHLPMLRARKRT